MEKLLDRSYGIVVVLVVMYFLGPLAIMVLGAALHYLF